MKRGMNLGHILHGFLHREALLQIDQSLSVVSRITMEVADGSKSGRCDDFIPQLFREGQTLRCMVHRLLDVLPGMNARHVE